MKQMIDETGKVRRTITLTTRQAAGTGLVGLAVALTPYLKETFVTQNENQAQMERLASLEIRAAGIEKAVVNTKADLSEKIDGQTDQIIQRVREMYEVVKTNSDRNERRIERLENEVAFSPRSKNHKGTN